jgi:hypothetical protein
MWRCGAPQYYGGGGPEPATDLDVNGNPQFWRAQYPGQPFRKNVHVRDSFCAILAVFSLCSSFCCQDYNGNEVAVCTPALTNAGSRTVVSLWLLAVVVFATVITAVVRVG